jgi:cell division protein FtsL
MKRKKSRAMTEFHTVRRIDNSRLVRSVEPARLRSLFKSLALGGFVAMFFMLYVFQHFRCIDLSFQLEALKEQRTQATALNSELRLERASLRNPMRIDVIARRQLGLTEPLPAQVREYDAPSGSQLADARMLRSRGAQ